MEIIHSGIGRSFRINSHNLSIAVNIVIFTGRPAFLDFFIGSTVIFGKYGRTILYKLAFHTTILTIIGQRISLIPFGKSYRQADTVISHG